MGPAVSAPDECQEIRIDHVGIRGHHAVWEAGVNLERPLLEQFGLQQCGVFVGHNLVIVALHHEGRHRDRFQIVRLVCLRESLDAFVDGRARCPSSPDATNSG